MAVVGSVLAGIGAAITAGAVPATTAAGAISGTAATIGGVAAATSLATTGLSIASAAGAFEPEIPEIEAQKVDEASNRRHRAALRARSTDVFSRGGPLRSRISIPTVLGPSAGESA